MSMHDHSAGTSTRPRPHRGHGLMMLVCCIPMIVIAVGLVASGAVGPRFLVAAAACVVMMTVMMRVMAHDGHDNASADGENQSAHGSHRP